MSEYMLPSEADALARSEFGPAKRRADEKFAREWKRACLAILNCTAVTPELLGLSAESDDHMAITRAIARNC